MGVCTVAADDPAVAFRECALQLCEWEMANPLPADPDAMFSRRRAIMDALRLRAGEALHCGTRRGGAQWFRELDSHLRAVLDACVGLQRRPLEYTPPTPEGYAFSGPPPYDFDAARARAANVWRLQTCGQLVGQVHEALQRLTHVWIAIGEPAESSTDNAGSGQQAQKADTKDIVDPENWTTA
jgi:hypothetical protein